MKDVTCKDYEYDLFIAYFCSETEGSTLEDAKTVYKELTERTQNRYKIFFYPAAEYKTGSSNKTPVVVEQKAKAFLLVGNGNLKLHDGLLNLWKQDENGNRVCRAIADEINSIWKNRFMSDLIFNDDETAPHPADLLSLDGRFSENCLPSDVLHYQTAESGNAPTGPRTKHPFSGSSCFDRNQYKNDDEFFDAVINWLQEIKDKYSTAMGDYSVEDLTIDDDNTSIKDVNLYWIGTRQSDISLCNRLFKGYICLFGEHDGKTKFAYCTENSNRIDHNVANQDADMYVFRTAMKIAEEDENARFYCYNQGIVYNTREKDEAGNSINPYEKEIGTSGKPLLSRFLCLNSQELINRYAKKDEFRNLCAEDIGEFRPRTVPHVRVTKAECQYTNLLHLLNPSKSGEEQQDRDDNSNVRFVIQDPIGSGGVTTYILSRDKHSEAEVEQLLKHGKQYICTVYQEDNIPVNVHALIFKDKLNEKPVIWLSAPSIQLLRESGNRLIYRGADYKECSNIPHTFLEEFLKQAYGVCERLSAKGYCGICGIDGIICNAKDKKEQTHPEDNVFVMEVNTRFQASSGLLNRGLRDNKRPTLQHLNLYAFYGMVSLLPNDLRNFINPPQDLIFNPKEKICVKYSNYSYIFNLTKKQAFHLLSHAKPSKINLDWQKQNHIAEYELDGLNIDYIEKQSQELDDFEKDAYLYRIVFTDNVCWANNSSKLYFNENVLDETMETYSSILTKPGDDDAEGLTDRMIRTKVALLIQGVNIDEEVLRRHALRAGTFQSVDIVFKSEKYFQNYVVNAPVVTPTNADEQNSGIKFTGMTPFLIRYDENDELVLTYYGQTVDSILLMPYDQLQEEKTENGIPYSQIAYLSTDRLRVHLTNSCKFKHNGQSCKFCGITPGKEEQFPSEEIKTVVNAYANRYRNQKVAEGLPYQMLRHFLLGGQTPDLDDAGVMSRTLDTIRILASTQVGDIYAMIVPCSAEMLISMKNSGLKQLAFNLELWDDDIAKEVMPGKRGQTGRELYLAALDNAKRTLRTHESVRSMLLIGLEPVENTMKGIRALLNIKVQPMLSIFRPMPGTEYKDYMSPQITDVVNLYHQAAKLCAEQVHRTPEGLIDDRFVIHLGPSCTCCQNNTVALPYNNNSKRS